MVRSISLYFRYINALIRSQTEYRFSFILNIISTAVFNGVVFLSFVLIMQRFETIAGWTLWEIGFIYGMAEFSFGMMDMVFSGFDDTAFSTMIRTGRFDMFLLRPVNLVLQIFGSNFELRRIGRILEGLVIFSLSISKLPIHWTLGKAFYLPLVVISQIVIFGALFIFGATLTFWTIQSVEAVNVFTYGGVEMTSYPYSIYPAWIKKTFVYLVPLALTSYFPALYFLDKPFPQNFPDWTSFLAPWVAGLFLLIMLKFWLFGVKNYQSTGT